MENSSYNKIALRLPSRVGVVQECKVNTTANMDMYVYMYYVCTYLCMYVCLYVCTYRFVKMTVDVCEGIDNPLCIIVSTTKRSGNMNKELKQTIWNRKYC